MEEDQIKEIITSDICDFFKTHKELKKKGLRNIKEVDKEEFCLKFDPSKCILLMEYLSENNDHYQHQHPYFDFEYNYENNNREFYYEVDKPYKKEKDEE